MNKTRSIMVLVAIALTMSVASATDWSQFQKDEISIGWTTDCAPIHDPPALAWSYNVGGWVGTTPIVGGGQVFVLSGNGWLYAFNPTTGVVNWHTDLTEGAGTFEVSVPAYNDGTVYAAVSSGAAGQGAGRVCAVYADNGTIREYKYYGLENFQLNTPITYADGKIYVGNWKGGTEHTEDNGTYYCIDASDVTNLIWSRTAPYCTGYYWAGAAIVGDYIIYGDDRANVTCLYKDNGTFVDYVNVSEAPFNINDPVEEIRSSITWDEGTGRIYFTGKKPSPVSGHAYAVGFNPSTGHFDTTDYWVRGIGYSTSTPVVYDGPYGRRVYACTGGMYGSGGGIRCLDESNGNELHNASPDASQSSPAISIIDGDVYAYFTTNVNNGSAYCYKDTENSWVLMWEWNPPEPDNQFILQGMAIADGMIYFGTDGSHVYALKEGQEQFEIPIYKNNNDPKNLFSIPLNPSDTTLVEVIGDDAANGDKVFRYVNGEGPKSATYFNGVWYGASDVEPIESGVGYEYGRWGGDAFNITNVGQLSDSMNTTIYGELFTGDPKNLIGYASFNVKDLSSAFGGHPVNGDKVYRYVNGEGPKSATYFNGVWYGASDVNPIELGIGYEYSRVGATFHWTYTP